jgi:hypothetical protein
MDVSSDIKNMFEPARYSNYFDGSDPVLVTVSLELLIYRTNSVQSMLWDDVKATATIPSIQNTTTSSTTLNSVTETSISNTVTLTSLTQATHSTPMTTMQQTPTGEQDARSPTNQNSLLASGALVLLIVALIVDITRRLANSSIFEGQTKSGARAVKREKSRL